jgi:tyrosine-protein kinase Etk/Wzc
MDNYSRKISSSRNSEDEQFNLNRYIEIIRKRKVWAALVFSLIFFPILVMTALQSFEPVYEATTTIWINSSRDTNPFLSTAALQNEGLIQILRSRTFAEKVVGQLGLAVRLDTSEMSLFERIYSKFSTDGAVDSLDLSRSTIFRDIVINEGMIEAGDYEIYITDEGFYYLYLSDEELGDTLVADGPSYELFEGGIQGTGFHIWLNEEIRLFTPIRFPFVVKSFRGAVEDFMDNTIVRLDESGTFLSLTLSDGDPQLATEMANTLAQMFVDYNLATKKEQLRITLEILEEQLGVASEVLAQSEQAIKEYKEQTGIVSLDAEVKERIEKLAEAETVQRKLIEEKDKVKDYMDRMVADTSPEVKEEVYLEVISYPWSIHTPNLEILKDELVNLRGVRNELSLKVTENHPEFQEVVAQIAQVHTRIEESAVSLVKRIDEEISFTGRIMASLRSELNDLPTEELTLARLSRERKVNENIYTQVVTKFKEAQIAEAAEVGDVSILDPAIVPQSPTNTNNRVKVVSIGFILGLILGVFATITVEFLDTTVKSEEDVKSNLKITVLGVSPLIEFDEKYEYLDYKKAKEVDSILVTHDYSPTPIGEAYRALRTNLMFSRRTGHNQTLMITSPSPEDGKSFTISNLSITMAQQGARVLLVDADLRRGVLHNTFACQKSPGLTEILTSRSHLMEALNETHVPNLFLVSCGNLIPNPSELLGSSRMMDFFHEVRERFDVIFFDTPPLGTVTDATVVGSQVDGVAIVLRSGKTDFREAQKSIELLENVSANIIGVILNGLEVEASRYKYSYYHY